MIRIKSDKIIDGDKIVSGYLYLENGKIAGLTQEERSADKEYDMCGLYVSPDLLICILMAAQDTILWEVRLMWSADVIFI